MTNYWQTIMNAWFQRPRSIENPKHRSFSPTENVIMKLSFQRQGYMKVCELLFLQGPQITVEALNAAIRHLQTRHPFLRSRLKNDPSTPETFLMEEDETVQLKIRQIQRNRNECKEFWRREYREHEKEIPQIGEPLVEFWLLQDSNDEHDDNAPREIVIVCEHSICDGVSLSVVAHELLIALTDVDKSLFEKSLPWPPTMENAISNTSALWKRIFAFGRFIAAATYWRLTSSLTTSKMPFGQIDFTLGEMSKHCHTEFFYDSLNKEETTKFIEKCKQQGVTITPAVGSAVIAAIAPLVSRHENEETRLLTSLAADTRRRCSPIVPNHDLSYHVAGMLAFDLPTREVPITSKNLWNVAKRFSEHIRYCIDSNQILSIGMIMSKLYQKSFQPPDLTEIPTCGISSWGILPFQQRYGQWQLNGTLPICNLISVPIPMILLQTVNGVLTVSCMGAHPVIPVENLENLCKGTMEKLRQMIEDI